MFLGHFIVGLWFLLESYLLIILQYYNLSLCVGTIPPRLEVWWVLSLFFVLRILHSLQMCFSYFFSVQMMNANELISVGAHLRKKLILEIPRKFSWWHGQFLFVSIPDDFSLPSHWKNLWKGHLTCPKLSNEEIDCTRYLMDISGEEWTFK